MLHFKFYSPTRGGNSCKVSIWEKVIMFIVKQFVPLANPTLESKIDDVQIWYIEYDESDISTNREIGIDANRNVIFKAPWKGNFGYWCDNNLSMKDYEKFNLQKISKEEFDTLWNCELKK